jgi:hypothetical protein
MLPCECFWKPLKIAFPFGSSSGLRANGDRYGSGLN